MIRQIAAWNCPMAVLEIIRIERALFSVFKNNFNHIHPVRFHLDSKEF